MGLSAAPDRGLPVAAGRRVGGCMRVGVFCVVRGGEGGEVLDHLGQAGHLPYPLQRRLTYLKPKLAMNYTAAISVVDTYNFDPDSDQGSEKFRYGSESRQKRKLVQENLKICYKKTPNSHALCV